MLDLATLTRRDPDSAAFLDNNTRNLPAEWKEGFSRRYLAEYAEALAIPAGTGRQSAAMAEANRRLAKATSKAQAAWLPLGASDADIREAAERKAVECWALSERFHDAETLRARMAARCTALGITPPNDKVRDMPAIKRMTDPRWWRRKIRRHQAILLEEIAIELGYVHRRRECYCSDETVKRRRAQVRRNGRILERTELENQFGYVATLAELAATSVANPRIKHAELMTRTAGFESTARSLGHVALFITVTCPSRFHAVLDNGRRNPKHDGSTPREAHQHLSKSCWVPCRSALHRRHVRPYGLRVVEPHHDGCPHWHLLLFVPADQEQTLRAIIRRYFLERHDPDEPGARANRVKFVRIDPALGSAAGYVAKYIAKGVDGANLDADHYGHSGQAAAERVTSWASAHGFRQFQFIGGPPVSIWRECRRAEASPDHPDVIAAARSAADAGNWERFVEVMGGPMVARKDMPIALARTAEGERLDPETGETTPAENSYGEPAAPAIFGVCVAATDQAIQTRRFRWITRPRTSHGERAEQQRPRSAPWRAQHDTGKAEGRAAGAAGAAWTRVNNCTETGADTARRASSTPANRPMRPPGAPAATAAPPHPTGETP